MKGFEIGKFPKPPEVLTLYEMREHLDFEPEYQRKAGLWSEEKRQLLIDSLLNEFDIPKLYLHELTVPRKIRGKIIKYAVVDGKQRLLSIFQFLDDELRLSSEFEYLHKSSVKAAGMNYTEVAERYPALKGTFDSTELPVVVIRADDVEIIEELFSRLNEALPLNAPEKRNALAGPFRPTIKQVAHHAFFRTHVAFSEGRYKYDEMATRFLYIEHRDQIVDTKKIYLDAFVKACAKDPHPASQLSAKCEGVLNAMVIVFGAADPLLASIGMVVLYYLLFREAVKGGWADRLDRTQFDRFERKRAENRKTAEKDEAAAVYHLLEFDRLAQSPNDGSALEYRFAVLRRYVGPVEGRPQIPVDL